QRIALGQITWFPFGTIQREREAMLIQNGITFEIVRASGKSPKDARLTTEVESGPLLSSPEKAADKVVAHGGLYPIFVNDTLSVDATVDRLKNMGFSPESLRDVFAAGDLLYTPSGPPDLRR
ncbi:MAG: hypothetical protein ABIQ99_08165, partial [Thermoflexales bacterium]